jgi:hypothetical protein
MILARTVTHFVAGQLKAITQKSMQTNIHKKNETEDYELQQNVLTKLLRDTKAHINHKSNRK